LKRHKKIYLEFFGYQVGDYVPCEVCTAPAVDIHHISPRGIGGDPQGKKDTIENLVALCRKHHDMCGNAKFNKEVKRKHLKKVKHWKSK